MPWAGILGIPARGGSRILGAASPRGSALPRPGRPAGARTAARGVLAVEEPLGCDELLDRLAVLGNPAAQDLAARLGHEDDVLDADPDPALGVVDAGLDREDHARLEGLRLAHVVDLHADVVAGAVRHQLREA